MPKRYSDNPKLKERLKWLKHLFLKTSWTRGKSNPRVRRAKTITKKGTAHE